MHAAQRIHYMDNLRALAMLAGVVFHAALAYSPLLHPYWPLADAGQSQAVDAGAWFLHLFRMPLFFVVAGFFAALLVDRRGMAGLFRNRIKRVLLPLLVFLPLVLVSVHWLTSHAVATIQNPSPALAWMRSHVGEHGTLPYAPSLAHLWFLFYLVLFTVMVWVVSTLELKRIDVWLGTLHPVVVPAAMPLLLIPSLASVTVPWPAPEFFIPSLWALLFFGMHFALGYRLFHRPMLLDGLRPFSALLLFGALATYAMLAWSMAGHDATTATAQRHLFHAALEACAGLWMTLWCLLAAKTWLDGNSPVMRWLADASYWVYLVHLPVLFAIQYPLLDVPGHWTTKFAISTLSTLAISFASYQLLVRQSWIGGWLNGRRVPGSRTPERSRQAPS